MDEMTLLEELCAAVPPPGQERLMAVRARVLAADDHSPAGRVRPGRSRGERGRTRLLGRLALALAGMTTMVTAVVLVVGNGLQLGGGSALVPAADAAQVLQRAAAAALAQPVPRGSQFIYTKMREVSAFGPSPVVTQLWQSVDGTRRSVMAHGPCTDVYGVHRPDCLWEMPGSQRVPAPETYAGLQTLPTKPGALLAYIDANYRAFGVLPGFRLSPAALAAAREWLGLWTVFMENPVVPPRLGAAIFRAAATLPGITVLPNAMDAAGGHGIAVATRPNAVLRFELIFNPRTYRFIGSQVVVNQRGTHWPPGTVIHAMAVLQAAITNIAPNGPFTGTWSWAGGWR